MAHSLTPVGQACYPTLIVARKQSEKAKPKFSITVAWSEDTDLSEVKAAIDAVCRKKYPDGIPTRNFRYPLRSGEDKRRDDGSMTPGFKPTDTWAEFWRYEKDKNGLDNPKAPVVGPTRDPIPESDIYAGCTVRVLFNPFCYDRDGNRGVSLGLEAVQKHQDGERVGAPPVDPLSAFGDLPVEELPF
jgi:hypothetical protein